MGDKRNARTVGRRQVEAMQQPQKDVSQDRAADLGTQGDKTLRGGNESGELSGRFD